MKYSIFLFLTAFLSIATFGQLNVGWQYEKNVSINGTTISKSGRGQGIASSENVLLAYGTNDLFNNGSFSFNSSAQKGKQIGYSVLSNQYFNKQLFKYSILFHKSNEYKVVEEGNVKTIVSYASGDNFKIAREDADIVYYQNNVEVYRSVNIDYEESLEINVLLKGKNTSFENVTASYDTKELKVEVDVRHESLTGQVNVSGGASTNYYAYEWSTGARVRNLKVFEKGIYTLKVRDKYGNEDYTMLSFGNDIVWKDFANGTSQTNTTLSKTGNGWGYAFSTAKVLSNKNGWFEYNLTKENANKALGFVGSSLTQVSDPTDIQYGFYISKKGFVRIIDNNRFAQKFHFDKWDIVKVDRIDDMVYFYINGVLVRESQVNASQELQLVGMLRNSTSMKNVRMDMEQPKSIYAEFDETIGYGKITANVVGGVPPYNYVISDYAIPDPILEYYYLRDSVFQDTTFVDSVEFVRGTNSNTQKEFRALNEGVYYVAIFDNTGKRIQGKKVRLFKEHKLLPSSQGYTINNNKIESTSNNAFGSLSRLLLNENDGFFKLKIKEQKGKHFYGFSEELINANSELDLLFGVVLENSRLQVISNGQIELDIPSRRVNNLTFSKQGSELVLYLGKREIFRKTQSSSNNLKISFGASLPGVSALPVGIFGFVWNILKPSIDITHLKCYSSDLGSLVIDLLPNNSSLNFGAQLQTWMLSITNESGAVLGTLNNIQTLSLQNLPAGIYRLSGPFTYTLGSNPNASSANYNRYIYVGFDTQFNSFVNSSSLIGDNSIIKDNSGTLNKYDLDAGGVSINEAEQHDPNIKDWFSFKVKHANSDSPFNSSSASFYGANTLRLSDDSDISQNYSANYFQFVKRRFSFFGFAPVGAPNNIVSFTYRRFYYAGYGAYSNSSYIGENDVFHLERSSAGNIKIFRNFTGISSYDLPIHQTNDNYFDKFFIIANMTALNGGFYDFTSSFGCYDFNQDVSFAKLFKSVPSGYHKSFEGKVNFVFSGEYNISDLTFELSNDLGSVVATNQSNNIITNNTLNSPQKKNNDNRFVLDLSCSGLNLPTGNYLLKVTNPKRESYYLRINHNQFNQCN